MVKIVLVVLWFLTLVTTAWFWSAYQHQLAKVQLWEGEATRLEGLLASPRYCYRVAPSIAEGEDIDIDKAIGTLAAARDAHWLSVHAPEQVAPYKRFGVEYNPGDPRWTKWDLDWVIRYQAIINLLEKIVQP